MSHPLRTRAVTLAGGLAALVIVGASPDAQAQRRALPLQCTFNDQCATGLICSAGYCRAECQTDRDCPDDRSCVIGWYDDRGHLLRLGRPGEAVAAGGGLSPVNPAERFMSRCQARAAQPAGAAPYSPSPVILPTFRATGVTLSAEVRDLEAPCPAPVRFTGWIAASGSGAVTYRFIRSDGAAGPAKVLKFAAAGQQPIAETWTLGATTKGALRVEVLSPNPQSSAPAPFSLTCGK